MVFGCLAYWLGIRVGSATGTAKSVQTVLGIAATALTGGIPTYEQWRQVKERRVAEALAADAQEELRVAVGDVLEPLTAHLGRINQATEPSKSGLQGEAVQMVLNAASGLAGTRRTRACFFRLTEGPPRRLDPEKWAGRSGQPHTEFVAGTAAGDAALGMLDAQDRRFCRDVAEDPPPGWTGTTSGYRTFVSVGVYAGTHCFGMLTLDALQPGDLDSEEASGLVDVFGHLLGAILSA